MSIHESVKRVKSNEFYPIHLTISMFFDEVGFQRVPEILYSIG